MAQTTDSVGFRARGRDSCTRVKKPPAAICAAERNNTLIVELKHAELSTRKSGCAGGQAARGCYARLFPYNERLSQAPSSPLNVRLDQYEGPLDLLLDLIRRQQIDIRNIPIASITSQYLSYLDQAREMDLDIGAEFVFMAATLIHIKSRLLLPTDPALRKEGEADEDPREELVQRLIEHERFKNAAEMLQQKRIVEENVWSNPQMKQFISEDEDPGLAVSLFDLIKAFGDVLERVASRPVYEIRDEEISVSDMVRHVRSLLLATRKDKPLFILQVMEMQRSRRAMICLFLAVLEMVKTQTVEILQADMFGEIALAKGQRFEEASAERLNAIEEDYK